MCHRSFYSGGDKPEGTSDRMDTNSHSELSSIHPSSTARPLHRVSEISHSAFFVCCVHGHKQLKQSLV